VEARCEEAEGTVPRSAMSVVASANREDDAREAGEADTDLGENAQFVLACHQSWYALPNGSALTGVE